MHSIKMTRRNSTFTVARRHDCGDVARSCVAVPVAGLIQLDKYHANLGFDGQVCGIL